MSRWAVLAARSLGLDEETQQRCALAARFHDVGKFVVPESILRKEGPLSRLEWDVMRMHPAYGAWLVDFAPGLDGVGAIIREHHERHDGSGYPAGKKGDEIRPEAAIVGVCDAWAAMRNGRAYAPARSQSEARAELLAARGTQFAPDVVETFLMFDEEELAELEELDAVAPAQRR
jgi:HD-GYP domain-containing protein (c-di-GMP phosphodiesterase class II)